MTIAECNFKDGLQNSNRTHKFFDNKEFDHSKAIQSSLLVLTLALIENTPTYFIDV